MADGFRLFETYYFVMPIVSSHLATHTMKDNQGNDFLNILTGEKLSSVTFVLNYLQLDFDGNGFTLYVWPVITVGGKEHKFGESSFRDSLCLLIAQVVKQAGGEEEQHLTITFESGDKLTVSLDPDNPVSVAPEIAIFTDTNGEWYVFE